MTAQIREVPAVEVRLIQGYPTRVASLRVPSAHRRPVQAPPASSGAVPSTAGGWRARTWSPATARACLVSNRQPEADPGTAGRLYWTPRGVAVLVLLVAVSVGIMVATVVMGFLSVSNEPLGSAEAGSSGAPAVVAAPAVPGR